jgi:hypothetical protein
MGMYNSTDDGLLLQQGWRSQPDGRGTLDIICSCCTTIFLCCWTALCLNVPVSTWSRWRRVLQKTLMACMGCVGSEFIFQLALGQWISARRSVHDFKRSGYPNWSMRHAFLADMGGFVLRPPDWVEFPLTAKQVHFLVTEGYIPYSAVGLEQSVIEDKNKGDGVVRFITVCQMLWFSVNCLGRLIQHLAITTMELTTLGFIVCTLGTYFLWARKPMDIGSAIVLEPNTTLREILIKAGDKAKEPYRCSPLDFVGRELSPWALYWIYWVNILGKFNGVFINKQRPIQKVRDDNFLPLSPMAMAVLFVSQIAFAGVHVCAWNIHFPTSIERLLWRISSLTILGSILVYWLVDRFVWCLLPILKEYIARRRRGGLVHLEKDPERNIALRYPAQKSILQSVANKIKNNSTGNDHAMNIPLKAILPLTTLGALYCTSRAYILLEDLLSLRELPMTAYETVTWSGFLPHF